MDQELTGELAEQLKKLPIEVQQAIQSPEFGAKLRDIGTKNKLHIDQMELLKDETLLVMLGIEDPANFYDNLIKQVGLAPDIAQTVQQDVADKVFVPIREAMKKFTSGSTEPAVVSNTPPAAPTTPVSMPVPPKTPLVSTPAAPVVPPMPPKPAAPTPNVHPAEVMLTEKTVQVVPPSKPTPPPPGDYKKDPYREPVEP